MTADNSRQKLTGDPRPQLDSVDLSAIRARYVTADAKVRLPAQVAADLDALWNECDRLRFELAGANERTRLARQERDSLNDQLYQVRARLPGAGRAV